MFKIGLSSTPRITSSEIPETSEGQPPQNVDQQIAPPESKLPAATTWIRSESMFSTVALRTKLTQQLDQHKSIKYPERNRKAADQMQMDILKTEQEINSQNVIASDGTDSRDQTKNALDSIQKFLDILRNMPKI